MVDAFIPLVVGVGVASCRAGNRSGVRYQRFQLFEQAYRDMSAMEHKWLIRLINKDLKASHRWQADRHLIFHHNPSPISHSFVDDAGWCIGDDGPWVAPDWHVGVSAQHGLPSGNTRVQAVPKPAGLAGQVRQRVSHCIPVMDPAASRFPPSPWTPASI